jgi:hypothetical protein
VASTQPARGSPGGFPCDDRAMWGQLPELPLIWRYAVTDDGGFLSPDENPLTRDSAESAVMRPPLRSRRRRTQMIATEQAGRELLCGEAHCNGAESRSRRAAVSRI